VNWNAEDALDAQYDTWLDATDGPAEPNWDELTPLGGGWYVDDYGRHIDGNVYE
jgi:hypothetical protein